MICNAIFDDMYNDFSCENIYVYSSKKFNDKLKKIENICWDKIKNKDGGFLNLIKNTWNSGWLGKVAICAFAVAAVATVVYTGGAALTFIKAAKTAGTGIKVVAAGVKAVLKAKNIAKIGKFAAGTFAVGYCAYNLQSKNNNQLAHEQVQANYETQHEQNVENNKLTMQEIGDGNYVGLEEEMYENAKSDKKLLELLHQNDVGQDEDGKIVTIDTSQPNSNYVPNNQFIQSGGGGTSTLTPTTYIAESIENAMKNQNEALDNYNNLLAQISPSNPDMQEWLESNLNSVTNPFTESDITEEKEENDAITVENIDKMKKELTFDESDFDAIEAYKMEIDGVTSYLKVTSSINVITDLDMYKSLGLNTWNGDKYEENGQTHYVARAYDVDGKPLDAVIESTQEAYLSFGGKTGSMGYAKLRGSGNRNAYCVEGYGAITFGGKEKYQFYLQGNYDGDNKPLVEISEVTGASISNVYKASILTSMETMRAVNNSSYEIIEGDGETIELDFVFTGEKIEHEIEENGHSYIYNAKDKVTITNTGLITNNIQNLKKDNFTTSSTSTLLTVEDALAMGYTMENLIEQGYEPISVDGKKFEKDENKKEDTKDKDTIKDKETDKKEDEKDDTKEKEEKNTHFSISVDKTNLLFPDKYNIFYSNSYATKGNYAQCTTVYDDKGNAYTVEQAIVNDVCTVEELLEELEDTYKVEWKKLGY